jgi:hypothetical protein
LCVKKKILLDIERSLWAGPTREKREELVGGTHPRKKRRACGRDPPQKKKKLNTTCCVKVIHRHKKAKLILYSYPTISYKGYNLTINKGIRYATIKKRPR